MNNLGIFDVAGRERIADWVMHGNGRFYQRHEIQARIVKLLGKIAGEIEQHLREECYVRPDHIESAPQTGYMPSPGDDAERVESHSL